MVEDRLVVEKRCPGLAIHDTVTDLPLVKCFEQAIARMIGIDDGLDALLGQAMDADEPLRRYDTALAADGA